MILASNLTKKFPGRFAVNNLTFEVGGREVVGFLGPNGSGKSTTLRMLCGFIAPSAGTAVVAGYDVIRHPLEVRRRIGYLPENCPLYPDMRVDEYLLFRAALKGVRGKRKKRRIQEVKEQCGLADSGRRLIGQLSKGYRQRVGLAEALVHDPELLILDEPTVGLDPNQIREVRELIRQLGTQHTVLLSTHMLAEVEAISRRVIIIKDGQLVASGDTDRLIRQGVAITRIQVEIKAPRPGVEQELSRWDNLRDVQCREAGDWVSVTMNCASDRDPRPALFAWAASRNWPLRELHREPGTLEDLFVALTRDKTSAARKPS